MVMCRVEFATQEIWFHFPLKLIRILINATVEVPLFPGGSLLYALPDDQYLGLSVRHKETFSLKGAFLPCHHSPPLMITHRMMMVTIAYNTRRRLELIQSDAAKYRKQNMEEDQFPVS